MKRLDRHRKSLLSIVGLLFVFFIISCSSKKEVTVVEPSKQRMHQFHAQQYNDELLLVGHLSIDNTTYPVEMYYGNRTVLVRKDPNQCITFSANKYLFGYAPKETQTDQVTITVTDAQTYQVRKSENDIVEESTVSTTRDPSQASESVMLPYRTMQCISEEEYILHVN